MFFCSSMKQSGLYFAVRELCAKGNAEARRIRTAGAFSAASDAAESWPLVTAPVWWEGGAWREQAWQPKL